jgi:hypothetical protein
MSITTEILIDDLILIIGFVILMLMQAIFINGWHELFSGRCIEDISKGRICDGNIAYKISPKFFEKHRGKAWTMPLWGCVKCESSIIGSITFWLPVLWVFGFSLVEIFIWMVDIVSLVTLNYWVYKKL